jgi:hypothetical protein
MEPECEKKKSLGESGLPEGDDTSWLNSTLHPDARISFPLPTPIGYDIRQPVLERGVSLLDMLLLTRTGSHR